MADGRMTCRRRGKVNSIEICKYGEKCYQKNLKHLAKFKHPAKKLKKEVDKIETRKRKLSIKEKVSEKLKVTRNGTPAKRLKTHIVAVEKKVFYPFPVPVSFKSDIKKKFKVDMPIDFYEFWEFCVSLNPANPKDALKLCLGLELVGPFDILLGHFKNRSDLKETDFLCHWRFYYDPPEFQTVLNGNDEKLFHIGYFRDDPRQSPVFVAANNAADGCTITTLGENLFAAVHIIINDAMKSCPAKKQTKLKQLNTSITNWAKKAGLSLDSITKNMKARNRKMNSRTFHGSGIVVPVDRNNVGYRPLTETNVNLKKMLTKIVDSPSEQEKNKNFEPVQEMITYIQFANDECDYGMGLELGLDLFCFGSEMFHSTIHHLLPLAYQLLQRNTFGDIIQAHLKNRRKKDFSIL